VLINNAGLAYVATVEDMTMEDWRGSSKPISSVSCV